MDSCPECGAECVPAIVRREWQGIEYPAVVDRCIGCSEEYSGKLSALAQLRAIKKDGRWWEDDMQRYIDRLER